jgi:hypothetical protein
MTAEIAFLVLEQADLSVESSCDQMGHLTAYCWGRQSLNITLESMLFLLYYWPPFMGYLSILRNSQFEGAQQIDLPSCCLTGI